MMTAFDILIDDHNRASALMDQIRDTEDYDEKRETFQELRQELESHAHLEEQIFYPFLSQKESLMEQVDEAENDHQIVRDLIQDIEDTVDEGEFQACFEELCETVDSHVEEEEDSLFKEAERLFEAGELEDLKIRLLEEKKNLSNAAA